MYVRIPINISTGNVATDMFLEGFIPLAVLVVCAYVIFKVIKAFKLLALVKIMMPNIRGPLRALFGSGKDMLILASLTIVFVLTASLFVGTRNIIFVFPKALAIAIAVYAVNKALISKGIWQKLISFSSKLKLPNIRRQGESAKSMSLKKMPNVRDSLKQFKFIPVKISKKAYIITGVIFAFVAVCVFGIRIFEQIDPFNKTEKTCAILSPLTLKSFMQAGGGAKPLAGEKCTIAKNSYLIKLIYKDEGEAQKARIGIVGSTEGKRDHIGALDWVTVEKNSSVFITDGEKLAIFVIMGVNSARQVKNKVSSVIKNDWNWQNDNLKLVDLGQDADKYDMGCKKPTVKDLAVSAHTVSSYPCSYANTYEGDNKLHLRCSNADGVFAQYFYKEVDISQTSKIKVTANIGIQDHSDSPLACSKGIFGIGYSTLLLMSEDPKKVLEEAPCGDSVSEDDWKDCLIDREDSRVISICELDMCEDTRECKFSLPTFGFGKEKLYVAFAGIDRWTDVDIRNWMDNLEICRE